MRLIDADHLHEVYMKWFKKEMLNDEKIAKTISWADALLNSEPTVEAIPIAWIEKWDERMNAEFYDRIKQLLGKDFDPIKSVLFKDLPCLYTVLKMIEDWRKENGRAD